jgi:hypothetical protein
MRRNTVIFISRMTSTSNFNTLMFVRLYLLLCTTTDCTSKIHIVQYTYVPSNNFFGDMFHLVRATSLFRDSAKVSLARESCARNDVNVSTMLFTVCPCHDFSGMTPPVFSFCQKERKEKDGKSPFVQLCPLFKNQNTKKY